MTQKPSQFTVRITTYIKMYPGATLLDIYTAVGSSKNRPMNARVNNKVEGRLVSLLLLP